MCGSHHEAWRRMCDGVGVLVGKAFLMTLDERMPRVCKAVIKANGGYFEESQICHILLHESIFEMFRSNRRVFVRRRVGERMISACVVSTVKHGGGVMVRGCFSGDTVSDLFRI